MVVWSVAWLISLNCRIHNLRVFFALLVVLACCWFQLNLAVDVHDFGIVSG